MSDPALQWINGEWSPSKSNALSSSINPATGMDALTHGIEAYLSPVYNPPADSIALDCVKRISKNILKAYETPHNRDARREMMMGALEGGLVFQKGLGSAHAMTTPLGEYKLHHGTLNAVVLPAVMRFNEPAAPEKYAVLRHVIGLNEGADISKWVAELNTFLGMPSGLKEMGISPSNIPEIAIKAEQDHLTLTNPRPIKAADYEVLLRESM